MDCRASTYRQTIIHNLKSLIKRMRVFELCSRREQPLDLNTGSSCYDVTPPDLTLSRSIYEDINHTLLSYIFSAPGQKIRLSLGCKEIRQLNDFTWIQTTFILASQSTLTPVITITPTRRAATNTAADPNSMFVKYASTGPLVLWTLIW